MLPNLNCLSIDQLSRKFSAASVDALVYPPTAEISAPGYIEPVPLLVGILQLDPEIMSTIQGLLTYLELCKLSQKGGNFLGCRDKILWRRMLKYMSNHTSKYTLEQNAGMAEVLPPLFVVDRSVKGLSDEDAAAAYKRAFINYVVYHHINGIRPYITWVNLPGEKPREIPYDLVLVNVSQAVEAFINHKNASVVRAMSRIHDASSAFRSSRPDYPPIPASIYLAVVDIQAKIMDRYREEGVSSQNGRKRLPILIDAIKENAFYPVDQATYKAQMKRLNVVQARARSS